MSGLCEHLCELTGDSPTGGAAENGPAEGAEGFLLRSSVQSDWRGGLEPPHRHRLSDSETNPPGAAGPSGLSAPQWKHSAASSLPDRLPASERHSKTSHTPDGSVCQVISASLTHLSLTRCFHRTMCRFCLRPLVMKEKLTNAVKQLRKKDTVLTPQVQIRVPERIPLTMLSSKNSFLPTMPDDHTSEARQLLSRGTRGRIELYCKCVTSQIRMFSPRGVQQDT